MNLVLHAVRMARAASRWIDPSAALELARNVTMVAHLDYQSGVPCDVTQVALEAIEHRARHWGLQCSDPAACAAEMAQSWAEDHEDRAYCSDCDATGESRYGEGKCLRCKGLGVIKPEPERDDDEPRQRVWSPGRWRVRAA